MKKLWFVLIVLIISPVCFAQQWTPVKVAPNVQVDFPEVPYKNQIVNKIIHQVNTSEYVVTVLVVDMRNERNFEVPEDELDKFYAQIVDETLNVALNPNVISQKQITIDDHKGIEIIFTKDYDDIEDLKIKKQIFLVDEFIISFELWKLTEDLTKIEETFFDSIQLN